MEKDEKISINGKQGCSSYTAALWHVVKIYIIRTICSGEHIPIKSIGSHHAVKFCSVQKSTALLFFEFCSGMRYARLGGSTIALSDALARLRLCAAGLFVRHMPSPAITSTRHLLVIVRVC